LDVITFTISKQRGDCNPSIGDPEIYDRILALGVRNARGLVYDPDTDAG